MTHPLSEFLNQIAWEPEHAAFQLSPNLQWARHERLGIKGREDLKNILHEVMKHYGLVPITQTDLYYYFGIEKYQEKHE